LLWTTSDSLRAIEDVQTLMNNTSNASALHSLSIAEARLATDRSSAISQEEAANEALHIHLPPVDLPDIAGTGGR